MGDLIWNIIVDGNWIFDVFTHCSFYLQKTLFYLLFKQNTLSCDHQHTWWRISASSIPHSPVTESKAVRDRERSSNMVLATQKCVPLPSYQIRSHNFVISLWLLPDYPIFPDLREITKIGSLFLISDNGCKRRKHKAALVDFLWIQSCLYH